MKIRFTFISLFLLLHLLQSCGSTVDTKILSNFPKYRLIWDNFYSNYGPPEGTYIEFAKKPTGYFVVEKNTKDMKVVGEHLYWSLEKKGFEKLPNKFLGSREHEKPSLGSYYGAAYSFDHSLYYNYPEAADESIAALEGMTNITDTLLEALARSYSIKCDQTVGGRLGQGGTGKIEKMSPEKANEFVERGKKLIETYEQLLKVNPHYATLVGKARTKLSNEYIYLWYELSTSGYTDLAKQFLKEGLYDDLVINFAKNMLASCPPNTILFTGGDNDTYPLFYVQEKLKFRQDIAVLNSSLANVPFYLAYYIKKNNLKTSLTIKDYENQLLEYVLLNNNEEGKSFTLKQFVNCLKNPEESGLLIDAGESKYISIPTRKIELMVTGNFSDEYEVDRKQALQQEFTIDKSYIFRSDIFEMDIIATNEWQRPIGYASSNPTAMANSIRNFTDNYGLVSLISPFEKTENTGYSINHVNTARLNKLLMQNYKYAVKNDKGYEVDGLVGNYLVNFGTLASEYIQNEEKEKGIAVLRRAEAEMPFNSYSDSQQMIIYFASLWCTAGEVEKGKALITFALDEIAKKSKQDIENDEREDLFRLVERVNGLARQYEMNSLENRIEGLLKELVPPDK